MWKMRRLILFAAVGLGLAMEVSAADAFLPLFLIERSTNANVIHYDAKVANDGHLDSHQPVIAYWVMAAKDGHREPLNILERTRAYGFDIRRDGANDTYTMKLVSDSSRPIRVYLKDGNVKAEIMIGGRRAFLQKIFITTRKGWVLNEPVSAELYGVDADTGEMRYEKVGQAR